MLRAEIRKAARKLRGAATTLRWTVHSTHAPLLGWYEHPNCISHLFPYASTSFPKHPWDGHATATVWLPLAWCLLILCLASWYGSRVVTPGKAQISRLLYRSTCPLCGSRNAEPARYIGRVCGDIGCPGKIDEEYGVEMVREGLLRASVHGAWCIQQSRQPSTEDAYYSTKFGGDDGRDW